MDISICFKIFYLFLVFLAHIQYQSADCQYKPLGLVACIFTDMENWTKDGGERA